ncbi:MAG: benzylsuccinate synthase gamma subunit family protein [Desulfatibacillaceae bacterium]|nr:benzylsuccinate synthase gamma subunit family protein [Desulfatibacillaceae bacterium]
MKYKESKNFFPHSDNPQRGDFVERVVDPRQAYYKVKPVNADDEIPADAAEFAGK